MHAAARSPTGKSSVPAPRSPTPPAPSAMALPPALYTLEGRPADAAQVRWELERARSATGDLRRQRLAEWAQRWGGSLCAALEALETALEDAD